MLTLPPYLPQDRLRALTHGTPLPDRTSGTALFADISGFTPLTESLRLALGPRRGAEELTRHLDAVYTALIAAVERFGGSVIGFAGDAILCWFDADEASAHLSSPAARGVACASAMQRAMQDFSTSASSSAAPEAALALKIAVASGPVRRLVVGDPALHYMDTLAGATVTRTATAEHLAQKGEVLVDEATLTALGEVKPEHTWRTSDTTGERFAVLTQGIAIADDTFATPLAMPPADVLKHWIHPAVAARAQAQQEVSSAEFRPCVALFVRFVGIDYDARGARAQCDAFIQQTQTIAARHDGAVLQLTIGDKGSYAYLIFGAFSAHEDAARRAVQTALDLRDDARTLGFLAPLQIGITQGVLYVGPYGSPTRRTFSALGDDVNLAARLMTSAAPGEILLSAAVFKAVQTLFTCEPRGSLVLKGKAEPVPAFAVLDARRERALRLQEPHYALPMVGRQAELQTINAKLQLAAHGQAQIIGIVAEAGVGKSRLVAEVIRAARTQGFAGYGGTCQSDALNTPYQMWKPIWQAFFGVDPELPLSQQLHALTHELETRAPERLQVLPLLSILLNLNIPDNDFTKGLEPKYRQSALWALLEDCLRAAAQPATPVLIVVEDMHWIDALSHDLLEALARALAHHAVCFVLAYRPPELARLTVPRLESLPYFTRINLHELTLAEAEQAIHAKLAQLQRAPLYRAYPEPADTRAQPELTALLMTRTQGNPFYLEELLNFLYDRGLDPRDLATLRQIELPDSLHTLILSRIDQLTESEQTVLRVASVIGRLFHAAWLTGYYPDLGTPTHVQADLEQLSTVDLTPLDAPEPELAYLFKHIVTHEVTYESLPFATRARLHARLAQYLETSAAQNLAPLIETIAEHYGRSDNTAKQREYFEKAGDAAQAAYANDAALTYYARLLPLLTDAHAQRELLLKRGTVFELTGQWSEAEAQYHAALALAPDATENDHVFSARCQHALGVLFRLRGNYAAALTWLDQARTMRETLADRAALGHTLVEIGVVYRRKGEYAEARRVAEQGLALARAAGDQRGMALALNALGSVAADQSDHALARTLHAESLALRRALGDKWGIAISLNNLGSVAKDQGDHTAARVLHSESLALRREIGDKWGIAASLDNLGIAAREQGDSTSARTLLEQSLTLRRELGDQQSIAASLNNLGLVASDQGDYATALAFYEEALELSRATGDQWVIAASLDNIGNLAIEQGNAARAESAYRECLMLGHKINSKILIIYGLSGVAAATALLADMERAARLAAAADALGAQFAVYWEPVEGQIHTRSVTATRAALPTAAFAAAWAAGTQMTLDEAVAEATQKPL